MTLEEINAAQILGNLTRNQAHAARALLDECAYCGRRECDMRTLHEQWDAANEATWWRQARGTS